MIGMPRKTERFGRRSSKKMVTVQGSKSTYKLNDRKNSSVEIHYGAGLLKVPYRRNGEPPETQPAVVERNATLDVAIQTISF
jgi:hypothetical protein